MKNYSNEYIGSLAIVLVSVLKMFHIDLGNDVIEAIITGIIAVYVAYKRFKKGDITTLGRKI